MHIKIPFAAHAASILMQKNRLGFNLSPRNSIRCGNGHRQCPGKSYKCNDEYAGMHHVRN
jgi:hypothetical protein